MSYFDGHVRELGPVPAELLAPLDLLLENSRDTFLVENAHKPNKFGDFEKSTQHIVFKFPLELEDHTRSKYQTGLGEIPCRGGAHHRSRYAILWLCQWPNLPHHAGQAQGGWRNPQTR